MSFELSPDDTAPQSSLELLDLELSDVLPPDPPSMAPPAWTIDDDDGEDVELSDPAIPTPWRPQKKPLIMMAVFVQVCLFVLILAGARSAYAHFDDTAAATGHVTHRKTAAVEVNFASRVEAHNKKWKGKSSQTGQRSAPAPRLPAAIDLD